MKPIQPFLLLFLISGMLFVSCKSKGPDPNVVVPDAPAAPGISGDFYLVQCSKADFDKLTKPSNGNGDPRGNVVFKYFIQDGKFTLKGWEIKGTNQNSTKFDSLPNVAFSPTTRASTVKYGDATSLGDFLLDKNQVANVQQALRDRNHAFVVFSPISSDGGSVSWEVGTSLNTLSLTDSPEPVRDAYLRPIPPYKYDLVGPSFLSGDSIR